MTGPLVIDVIGTPAPQGSKRHVGNGVLIESSPDVKPWRVAVAYAARTALHHAGREPLDGPLELAAVFYLPRPTSVRRELPHVKPDLDKLLRATLDGLADGGVIGNDSQITDMVRVAKRYADGRGPGAVLRLETVEP